ncbi:MAG: hypothetical protein PHV74_06055 [Dehalococcoidia bacterium]|nr:hypothetical protein [Dehalococcoidia bacterium]
MAYVTMDQTWEQMVREKVGDEVADECRRTIWPRLAKATTSKLPKAFNISVKDIVDVMKVWQLGPDGIITGIYDSEFEVKGRNHVIHTITRCRTLEYFEKNAPQRIEPLCRVVEQLAMEAYLKVFLPDAKVRALNVPTEPRKNPEDIACQWEFVLDA